MGKPEIVEISKYFSDDGCREARITFGECDNEFYKLWMEDRPTNKVYFLYCRNLTEAEDKAEDFVKYEQTE